ncbi:MAG: PRC-barrel domain-containing protein [Alphaproteobacteria bacterium]|nr:PRC-barrel domain-containing protein [Alphaproteobacteria bacterium]
MQPPAVAAAGEPEARAGVHRLRANGSEAGRAMRVFSILSLLALAAVLAAASGIHAVRPAGAANAIPAEAVRAGDLLGKPVLGPQGERLGAIEDVLIPRADNAASVVIALASPAGKRIAVPLDSLTASGQAGYVLDVAARPLDAYPEYRGPRDGYTAAGRARLSEWEAKVGEFAEDARRKTEAGAAEASARIGVAWDTVKQRWRALGEASGEKWDAAKRAFEQSWQDFQREWSRSTQ